jgi:acetyltransferase-like isoleucine patch superfamily enzyme
MRPGFWARLAFWTRAGTRMIVGRSRASLLRAQGAHIGRGTSVPSGRITWPHQLKIGANCVLEDDLYFKFDGIYCRGPAIVIGAHVFIGRGCEFNIRKGITVGDYGAIASGCKFVDHDHGITGDRIDETPGVESEIAIGAHVWLGCNAVVLKGVSIGSGAVVAAGAVVTRSIPAREIWAGVPARCIGVRGCEKERSVIQGTTGP